MASTDARPGFRLPWSSDRPSSDAPEAQQTDGAADVTETVDGATLPADAPAEPAAANPAGAAPAWPTEDSGSNGAAHNGTRPAPSDPVTGAGASAASPPPTGRPATPKKPTKFMADLTKAMQAAAEEARGRTIAQLQADAKTHVETIHDRSATEGAGLRRGADDDVAAIRDWSKAEIARIREETEAKITDRKARLEREIEEHAAVIEREIDRVKRTVGAFEEEMAAFFDRLLAEEDPSRFATMAENLPEPPPFGGGAAAPVDDASTDAPVAAATPAEPATETVEATAAVEPTVAEPAAGSAEIAAPDQPVPAAAAADDVADAAPVAGSPVDAEPATSDEPDPRLAALAASGALDGGTADSEPASTTVAPDLDAAEAEALAAAGAGDEDGDPRTRRSPRSATTRSPRGWPASPRSRRPPTRIPPPRSSSSGSVSVASIASFKRHLGRLTGVRSVGVSSGPDGEFIFAVAHAAEIALARSRSHAAVVPGARHRIGDGVIKVTAHDPEHEQLDRRRTARHCSVLIPEASRVARPAIVIALPPDERGPVADELRAAGFEAITIGSTRRARGAPRRATRHRRRDPRWRGRLQRLRSSTTGCCTRGPGASRP